MGECWGGEGLGLGKGIVMIVLDEGEFFSLVGV